MIRSVEVPRLRRAAALATLPFMALVAAGGCGGDGDGNGGTGPGPTVATVEVSPSSATLNQIGATQQFSATARDQDGNPLSGVAFNWSSDAEDVATVDQNGLATAQCEGMARVEATADGITSGADLSVELPQPAAIGPVSGGGQNGMTTREFANPLVVSVSDGQGDPVCGATVEWSVEQGAAAVSAQSTTTDGNGEARVIVTSDTLLASHVVRATLRNSTAADSTVDFDLETTVAWFRIGDDFFEDWQGRQNTNFAATGNIVVGDTVMWEYDPDGATTHTVTSGEGQGGNAGDGVPAGGSSFDSGSLSPGDSFRWVPDAAGTWTYFCQIHPTIMFDAVIEVNSVVVGSREGRESAASAGSRYEVGDVVRPEGSAFAFIYLGPPSSASRPAER